jgi:SUKH-4 immunity protein
MDTLSIKKYWTDKGEALYSYKRSQLDNKRLNEITRRFLAECGLPKDAAPGLSFDNWESETIPTPNQVLRIDFEELNDYLMIGSNGSGDPICIDLKSNNEVVYLNHDNYFKRVFMNSSVSQLLKAIIRYESFGASLNPTFENNIFSKRKFSDKEYNQLKQDFLTIDNHCLDDNSWWLAEVEGLLCERDNE